jgi:hypothetical protein
VEAFEDVTRTCGDCGEPYIWRAKDQRFAATQGWLPPKRCPECRARRNQQRQHESLSEKR